MKLRVVLVRIVKLIFPLRFILARFTRLPGIHQVADGIFFKQDAIYYLPKDRVVIGENLNLPESVMLPSLLVENFLSQTDEYFIMNQCVCRAAEKCEHYPIDKGCLFMGPAVRKIPLELGRLATRDEAREHLRQCREAGLFQMIGRDQIDTVILGAKPAGKMVTICNCCSCCCAYKLLPDLDERISSRIVRLPGVHVKVSERCIGCGLCTKDVCFVKAIRLVDGHAVIDDDLCRGCGSCVEVCPQHAISLTVDDPQWLDKAICRLSEKVDLSSPALKENSSAE